MGEVYRARDTRLGRQVAIKALPEGLARDAERLARFDREARLLATVNHPRIAAIYGLEQTEAGPLLVLELVEGKTLAERIARGPLACEEATAIAGQIADALEAAHEQGIVHRDLKPANVKVREDGAVKVLDFGLAKAGAAASSPVLSDSPTASAAATRDGVILGTAAYMSPEQARGKAVDGRTDVWAFGCVLYEMLSGRLAFGGETVSDVIAAILGREPDWDALPPATPAGLRRVLRRCLEKDPKRRLHHFADVRIEVEEALGGENGAARRPDTEARAARRWRLLALASGLAALTFAGLAAMLLRRGTDAPAGVTGLTSVSQLTRLDGTETSGALSPDGRSFAFVSRHGGTPDIWVRRVAGGEPVRLTNDAAEESDLVYAPDGETLYFTRDEAEGPSIFRIGALGGPPRRVRGGARQPAPSPDGRRVAYYAAGAGGNALVVSALDGSETRTLLRDVVGQNPRPAWSPDGRSLSYITSGLFAPSNLFAVDAASGQVRQLTRFERSGEGIASQRWLPDGRIAVAYSPLGSVFETDLGILDVARGTITRLTLNVDELVGELSVSADGSRLIATATKTRRELWKVPLGADPDANARAATRVLDESRDPMWIFVSRDGRTLLFNSSMAGSRNLWTMPLDRSEAPRQITTLPENAVMHSSLSPDGNRVAFASRSAGHSDVWLQNVDGSDLRQLTNDDAADSWPVWSPDGRWIAFGSLRGGNRETWRVGPDGGRPERMMDGFFRGDWVTRSDGSGQWIVTSLGGPGVSMVVGARLIDVERRTVVWERRLPGTGISLPVFSTDRQSISLAGQDPQGRDVIWALDPGTGDPRVLVRFADPFRTYFRASWVDGDRALIVNRYHTVSRIVLFDRFWRDEGAATR